MAAVLVSAVSLRAQVITGTITDYPGSASAPYLTFGDGTHTVALWWSINTTDKGWFYGSAHTTTTDVALATGVSSINQITNASSYSFVTSSVGPVFDANANGGVGQFVILRNQTTGYYGVVRIDDIHSWASGPDFAALNATWWFQSGGGADFSAAAVPEPATGAALFGLAALAWASQRQRRIRALSDDDTPR